MKRIGIMGGTFDPVHNGHLLLGQQAYREYGLEEIWYMPSHIPPHKRDHHVADGADRLAMLRLALEETPGFLVSDFEMRREGTTYTAQTLGLLKEQYPDTEFYFIIGADSLFSIEQWVHVERLFPTCTVLAAFRDDKSSRSVMRSRMRLLRGKYQADIRLLTMPPVDVSSHELRRMLMEHADVSAYLPEAVEAYIRENRLYA